MNKLFTSQAFYYRYAFNPNIFLDSGGLSIWIGTFQTQVLNNSSLEIYRRKSKIFKK